MLCGKIDQSSIEIVEQVMLYPACTVLLPTVGRLGTSRPARPGITHALVAGGPSGAGRSHDRLPLMPRPLSSQTLPTVWQVLPCRLPWLQRHLVGYLLCYLRSLPLLSALLPLLWALSSQQLSEVVVRDLQHPEMRLRVAPTSSCPCLPAHLPCCRCCIGERVAGSLSLRIQQLDVRCETKTKVSAGCSSCCCE